MLFHHHLLSKDTKKIERWKTGWALNYLNRYNQQQKLRRFVKEGRLNDIAADLDEGWKVDQPLSNDNESLLIEASVHGHLGIVHMLVNRGANPNHQDICGESALHKAAERNYSQLVTRLIEAGANYNLKGFHQRTPLLLAAH